MNFKKLTIAAAIVAMTSLSAVAPVYAQAAPAAPAADAAAPAAPAADAAAPARRRRGPFPGRHRAHGRLGQQPAGW